MIGDPETGSEAWDDPTAVDMMLQYIYEGDYGTMPPWLVFPSEGGGPGRGLYASIVRPRDMDSKIITTHMHISTLGDKYDMIGLSLRAADKFEAALSLEWNDQAICAVISTLYASPGSSTLKGIVVKRIHAHGDMNEAMETLIHDIPELAYDLYKHQRKAFDCPECHSFGRRICGALPAGKGEAYRCTRMLMACRCIQPLVCSPECGAYDPGDY